MDEGQGRILQLEQKVKEMKPPNMDKHKSVIKQEC